MTTPSTSNAAAFKPDLTVSGGVLFAPLGTALPTDASTALAAAYVQLGYVTDDGVEPSRDVSTDKPKAWGGDIIAQLKSDDSRSFKFTLIEIFKDEVQQFIYETDNVTVTAATTMAGTKLAVLDKAVDIDNCVMVFEMKYKGKRRRLVVPVANSVVTGEGKYADTELSTYEITVEATKDDTGTRVYDYLENDDKTVA